MIKGFKIKLTQAALATIQSKPPPQSLTSQVLIQYCVHEYFQTDYIQWRRKNKFQQINTKFICGALQTHFTQIWLIAANSVHLCSFKPSIEVTLISNNLKTKVVLNEYFLHNRCCYGVNFWALERAVKSSLFHFKHLLRQHVSPTWESSVACEVIAGDTQYKSQQILWPNSWVSWKVLFFVSVLHGNLSLVIEWNECLVKQFLLISLALLQ